MPTMKKNATSNSAPPNPPNHVITYTRKKHSRGSDYGPEPAGKRNFSGDDCGSDGAQEKKAVKGTDTPIHGFPLQFGPTSPLPDKKLLVSILDKLQEEDSYDVFSVPVDIEELPDYFEVIDQAMDFGTVREKLDGGAYKSLKELEADVLLICSNAMAYNAEYTIYYKQAESMLEIAKREFGNLRQEGANSKPQPMVVQERANSEPQPKVVQESANSEPQPKVVQEGGNSEPQPKVVRRGRPPGNKNKQKILEASSSVELPSDTAGGSTSYNLRKAPPKNRYRSSDMFRPRNGEKYSEWLADWNDEFPAKILRADMKHGKKQFPIDVTRRDTYNKFHPMSNNSSNPIGDTKQLLVPVVGLDDPLAYARSVARFAKDLGPVARKIASRKIESALPDGVPLALDLNSIFGPTEGMVEAVRKLNNDPYMKRPFPAIDQQMNKPVYQSQGTSLPQQTMGLTFVQDEANVQGNRDSVSIGKFGNPSCLTQQARNGNGAPMRIQAGSPGSSLQPGSALQLF